MILKNNKIPKTGGLRNKLKSIMDIIKTQNMHSNNKKREGHLKY